MSEGNVEEKAGFCPRPCFHLRPQVLKQPRAGWYKVNLKIELLGPLFLILRPG